MNIRIGHWINSSLCAMLVTLTFVALGWLAREANIVRERRAFIREVCDPEHMPVIYFYFPDENTSYPEVPVWRSWLGDFPHGGLVLKRGASATDIQRAEQLFPEAFSIRFPEPGEETWSERLKMRFEPRQSPGGGLPRLVPIAETTPPDQSAH